MSEEKKKLINLGNEYCGKRLDKALTSELSGLSREKIQNLINSGFVTVNGQGRKPGYRLKIGEHVEINLKVEKKELKPFDFKVNIVYEDKFVIVVYKPPGLTVHPPQFSYEKTLVNALLSMGKDLYPYDPLRPGVVHRLDKETTGLLVLAKNKVSYYGLVEQFKSRTVEKEYRAVCHGSLKQDYLRLDLPLARDKRNPLRMKVSFLRSKNAQTDIKVLQRFASSTYLSIKIMTGRMHQIRVHLKFLGNSILGDKKYGVKDKYDNFFLHAHRLNFSHPKTGETMKFISRIPDFFSEYLRKTK